MGNLETDRPLLRLDRLEDILAALDAEGRGRRMGATEAATIRKKSPTACKVSLKLLVESPYQLHFVDEMRMEYGIMVRLIHHPDFREGVRALLIDKDNAPNWHPSRPEAISDADIDSFFEPLPDEEAVDAVRSLGARDELRNHPGRAEGRGDAGHAQPPAGAERAQLARCSPS